MSIPYLILTADDGSTYNFPADFWINDDPFSSNTNIANKFFAAGGKNISDGYLTSRVISIGGQIRGDTPALFETAYRAFMKAVLKGGFLTKSVDEVARFIDIRFPNLSTGREEKQQYKELAVDFVAQYPFWQESSYTTDVQIVAGDATLSVDNSDSDYLLSPIIQIEADQGVDVPSVVMTNLSDGGAEFEYNDPDFVDGDVVVIDCAAGTVKRNANSTIEFFNPARFFRLRDTVNTIDYQGAACTISFIFRKVYI